MTILSEMFDAHSAILRPDAPAIDHDGGYPVWVMSIAAKQALLACLWPTGCREEPETLYGIPIVQSFIDGWELRLS